MLDVTTYAHFVPLDVPMQRGFVRERALAEADQWLGIRLNRVRPRLAVSFCQSLRTHLASFH